MGTTSVDFGGSWSLQKHPVSFLRVCPVKALYSNIFVLTAKNPNLVIYIVLGQFMEASRNILKCNLFPILDNLLSRCNGSFYCVSVLTFW